MKVENAQGTPVYSPFKNKGALDAKVSFTSFIDTAPGETTKDVASNEDDASDASETSLTDKDTKSSQSILDEFAKWANMTPSERIRAQYLEAHGMSEADVAHLPPDLRQTMEDEIRHQIEQQANEAAASDGPAAL